MFGKIVMKWKIKIYWKKLKLVIYIILIDY